MAPNTQASPFDYFYYTTTDLCDCFLSSVRSLHNVYQVEHNSKIFESLTQLQKTVDKIRKSYGIEDCNGRQKQPRSELQLEIQDLRTRLEKRKLDLENANKKIKEHECEIKERQGELKEYRNELTKSNATVENLREELASKYIETKDFDLAAQQYRDLSTIKAEEREMWSRKDPLTNRSAWKAQVAELAELEYKFKYGIMLVKKQNYPDAEVIFDDVLKKLKRDYSDNSDRIRDVQSELCRVLRLQRTEEALVRAEKLYSADGFLGDLSSQTESDRTWAVRNAFGVVRVRAEQGNYESAIAHLKYVWPYRHYASTQCIQEMNSGIIWLLQSVERQGKGSSAEPALEAIREGDETLSPQLVRDVAAVGQHLRGNGKNKRAMKYLQFAWMNISSIEERKERLSLGWSYLWSIIDAGEPVPEKNFFKHLLKLSNTQTDPKEFREALLAHTQFTAGKFTLAKQTAQALYDQIETSTILPSHMYHHADILIRAIAQVEYYKGKWTKAAGIWESIYEKARSLPLSPGSGDNRDRIEHHAAAGLQLAEKWKLWGKGRRKKDSERADTIRQQAEKLKARIV